MADYPTKQFFGTAQTVINTAVDIAAGNFSGAPAAVFDNTNDAAVPYASQANAVLVAPDWGAAPSANGFVELWGVLQDVDGTSDDTDAPASTSAGGARFFGTFPIAAADALQRRTIPIDLRGVKKCNFYLKNSTDQNMNNDAGTNCTLKIEPFAEGVTV